MFFRGGEKKRLISEKRQRLLVPFCLKDRCGDVLRGRRKGRVVVS